MKVEERCGYRKGRSGVAGKQVREKNDVKQKVQGGGEVRRDIRASQIGCFHLSCGHHARTTRKLTAGRNRVS